MPKRRAIKNAPAKDAPALNLIFLGDPASGKATQSARIMRKFPMHSVDFGKFLRTAQHSKSKNPVYIKIRQAMRRTYNLGKPFPTNFAREYFKKQIFSVPKNRGILFDGNPKMLGEARLVRKWMQKSGRTKNSAPRGSPVRQR